MTGKPYLKKTSLLEGVDFKHKVVKADVFLQPSLQSSQNLHLEHYTKEKNELAGHKGALLCHKGEIVI